MMRHQWRNSVCGWLAMYLCLYYVEWSISSFITERILMKLAPNDSYILFPKNISWGCPAALKASQNYTQDIAASGRLFCPSECFREGVSGCCAAMPFWLFSHPHLMNFYAFLLDGEKWSRALEISKFYQLSDGINLIIF